MLDSSNNFGALASPEAPMYVEEFLSRRVDFISTVPRP